MGRAALASRLAIITGAIAACAVLLGVVLMRETLKAKPKVQQTAKDGFLALDSAPLPSGRELYKNYCAACHGDNGDGNGPAARFLFPKPRNFGQAKFRIVSTTNRLPTDDDLMQVLNRGMPGSAMFPFAHLAGAERRELVTHVRTLMRTAMDERLRREAAKRGDEVNSAELADDIKRLLDTGLAIDVPVDFASLGQESIARGRDLYLRTCAPCHGQNGKGDGVQDQHNDDGTPTRPRDFTRGIFKGGRDPRQLYARIMLGMPGSPMPASLSVLPPAEIGDIVQFILSLAKPDAQKRVEHTRQHLVVHRIATALSGDIPEQIWKSASASPVVVSPLWWRDYAEPDLQVQALHDGHVLALRLIWADATLNDQAVRPQDFEDMAAVQLYKGPREPFLGMGLADHAVDIWLWRASWQSRPEAYADVDQTYPHMSVDLYPYESHGKGARPHATENQPREFLTAQAVGNLRSDPTQAFTGNSITARGVGSITMRPRLSQQVGATGSWREGRWTVILRRPLEVAPDAGIAMAPGERISIAFALWDGAARDRNGQKLVSIWHDLQLEDSERTADP
jgi:mono/diheme cytochrome c family protein